jgi:hypothetical protein
MKRFTFVALAICLSTVLVPPSGAQTGCRGPRQHSIEAHSTRRGHLRECKLGRLLSLPISKTGGLGQIELHKGMAAVLQRDEGIVTLIDMRNPFGAKVLGRYDDGAQDSLDGDVVFSDDGEWVFYARQTVQFSRDGVHVLDVSDPREPRLASYQPGGGSFRIAYYRTDDAEYVVVLDAVDGLVVNRFVRESGTLVKVFQDAEPALKVGGPSSAGVFIDPEDPITGAPLMYVTTGRTGLQVYDMSAPESPEIVGTWDEIGLSDVEVRATRHGRTVWAASEYWFDKSLKPEVVVLDATKLEAIEKRRSLNLGLPADDLWRVQGIDRRRGGLFVAHSHAGVVVFAPDGSVRRAAATPFEHRPEAGMTGSVYAMDVELRFPYVMVTDASTGRLIVYARPGLRGGH